MKKKITQRRALSDFYDARLNPVLNRVYANRGIRSVEQLNYKLSSLPHPDLFDGMNNACEILYTALMADANILIVGDYDVDGATSTVLAKIALESFGAKHVAYFVPDRFTFGYGLSVEVIEAIRSFQPDVLLTVDNGISSLEGVEAANQAGISVIITDHHLPGAQLPQADAIINPNLPGNKFPGKMLAGVGVIFYLMMGLRLYLRNHHYFSETKLVEPAMTDLLDLVALGTTADLVSFDRVNRLLVQQGILRIRTGQCRAGIQALLKLTNKSQEFVTTSDLGFIVAPRINAAGRMQDMSYGLECLLAVDDEQAMYYAQKLDEVNRQRRSRQQQMNEQAFADIHNELLEDPQSANLTSICLWQKNGHPGIVGLIASRLKESFNKPSIVFATDGDELKGSARSIRALHMRDCLANIAKDQPQLIKKYGGHAMAAGLTINLSAFDRFAQAFESEVASLIHDQPGCAEFITDGGLNENEINLDLAFGFEQAGPWGIDFEEPVFDDYFQVKQVQVIGDGSHLRFKLSLDGGDKLIAAIAFSVDRYYCLESLDIKAIHAVYRLSINRYKDIQSLQLVIDYFAVE